MQFLIDFYALIFARPFFYRMNRGLFRLGLAGMGVLNWRTETLRGEDAVLARILKDIPDGSVVLDVGANEGDYCAEALKANPNLQIHAFEPHPDTFQRLESRFADSRVKCWNTALGEVAESKQLFDYEDVSDGSSHASLHAGVIEKLHGKKSKAISVRVERLDEFTRSEEIDRIAFLKIDTEGNEAAVLRGLGDRLSSGELRIDNIQIEFGDMNVMSRTFFEDLSGLLTGFRAWRILPRGALIEITDERPLFRELFAYQNVLFTRKNHD